MQGKEITILSCPQFETVAKDVAQRLSHYRKPVRYSQINWGEFGNGFPKISLDAKAIEDNHVWFFASFDNPIEVFRQLAVIYAMPRYLAFSLKVILPFYPTGTNERVDEEGEIAIAMTMARMISATPLAGLGPVRYYTFDIHALGERFIFKDEVLPVLKTAIPYLVSGFDSWSVAFPDEGAQKRFDKILTRFPQIICQKVRQGDKRIVTLKEGDVRGKKILVVDDLTRTCGTFIECAKVLKSYGADSVNVVVPHSAFDDYQAVKRLIEAYEQGIISRYYTTDSCPLAVKQLEGLNFVFIKTLAVLLEETITKVEF